ncbi:hypothetical protein CTAYLR_000718 [Chrysophaeum taylorii]|uniref:PCI domain-containing protein n=1 Tax=Chrysophaeum taylorii TaxID=2483200 RepID=A0AAD7XJ88_9STRA|nr:hypothetical protein CTAYLR_000718 [Chrysophaeum taylorii]
MEEVRAVFASVGRCVKAQNGAGLAAEVTVQKGLSARSVAWVLQSKGQVEAMGVEVCGEKWGVVAAKTVCGRAGYEAERADIVYDSLVGAYNALLNVLREEGGWVVPAVRVMTIEARVAAERADAGGQETVREVEATLKKGFSACWTDRAGKRVATLYVVSQLMKIYFRLYLVKLAQPLIRSLEAKPLEWSQFPKGDVVMYRYFVGRLRMFEDQYAAAEEHLEAAFSKCRKDAIRNKRAILAFLLPIRLRRGVLPTQKLLEKYGFVDDVGPLVAAIKSGDARSFERHLERHQLRFVKRGTFLLIEKCKILVYRSLLKKIYLINNRTAQLKLDLFATALAALSTTTPPPDPDDVECLVANLMYKNLVKGYISHTKQTLVLSKKDPFPHLASSFGTGGGGSF